MKKQDIITFDEFIDHINNRQNLKRFTKVVVDLSRFEFIKEYAESIEYKYKYISNTDHEQEYTVYLDQFGNLMYYIVLIVNGIEFELGSVELWKIENNNIDLKHLPDTTAEVVMQCELKFY